MNEIDIQTINLLLILVPIFLSLIAQTVVNSKYQRYLKIRNTQSMTGKEAAIKFLRENGVDDVEVKETRGFLTDHYDPSKKAIYLSSKVYNDSSVASVAIACHEAGHALQHNQGYSFIKLRTALVKPVQFANQFSWILIFLGLILGFAGMFWIGIVLFGIIAIFQLVTLPVELNASARANTYLSTILVEREEIRGVKSILRAAAFTYLVGLLVSLAEIGRFILLFIHNNRD